MITKLKLVRIFGFWGSHSCVCVCTNSVACPPHIFDQQIPEASFLKTRISVRYAAFIIDPAGGGLALLIFVSPLPYFLISQYTNTIIISRLHFFVVVFVVIMRACRNRFIPHYHADVVLYPVNMC